MHNHTTVAMPMKWPLGVENDVDPTARILLVDDHELIRKGLASILAQHPGWEICGEAASGREAVAMATELKPDVVILDIGLPELNGLEVTRQIVRQLPSTEVVILTVHESENLVREVLNAGAHAYVLKSDASTLVIRAIESVLNREPFLTSSISRTLLRGCLGADPPEDAKRKGLTPREREILQLLAEGKSNKEIADDLRISVKTAETHRTNMMRKLDVHCVADLVRYSIRMGLVEF